MAIRHSIWYGVEDRLPEKSGYYLAYRAESLGDDTIDVGHYWYSKNQKKWYENSRSSSPWARVVFWTDADPFTWAQTLTSHTPTAAETAAWQEVVEAIERYKLVKALTQDEN